MNPCPIVVAPQGLGSRSRGRESNHAGASAHPVSVLSKPSDRRAYSHMGHRRSYTALSGSRQIKSGCRLLFGWCDPRRMAKLLGYPLGRQEARHDCKGTARKQDRNLLRAPALPPQRVSLLTHPLKPLYGEDETFRRVHLHLPR